MTSLRELRGRPARRWIVGLAALAAAVVALVVTVLGGSNPHTAGAAGYFVLALVALGSPKAIPVQVAAGVGVTASLLTELHELAVLAGAPVVAGVIVVAELTGAVTRLDMVVERMAGDEVRRSLRLGVTGSAAFAAVVLLGALPTPAGPVTVALAATACVALAYFVLSPSA